MTTTNFSSATIGWVAIITGVSAILAVIFLTLMFTVNRSFGKVNDIFNSIIGVSSPVLAWMLYTEYQTLLPRMSQIALALAVVGAIFTIVGSILIIYGYTDFVFAGWFTGLGNALIGLWLVAFCFAMIPVNVFPHNLVLFGIVVGAFMAFGLIGISGIIARIDSMETLSWYHNLAFFGYLGTYILFPIWTILMGRNLLLK